MPLFRPLLDEIRCNQDRQLTHLELPPVDADDSDDDDNAPGWGADPFDVLAHAEEEQGYPLASS